MPGNKTVSFSQLLGRWVGSSPSLIRVSLVCPFVKSAGNAAIRIIIIPKKVSRSSAGEGGSRGVHFDLLALIKTGSYLVSLAAGLETGLQAKA